MDTVAPDSARHRGRRLLVVHGDIYGFGGAELVALRVIRALQSQFDAITVIHAGGGLDCGRIEGRCGIRLDPDKVTFSSVRFGRILPAKLGNWALLKYALALRYAGRIAEKYSAVITTYGECTFAHANAVQYVHFPLFFGDRTALERLGAQVGGGVGHFLRRLYVHVARSLAGWDLQRVRSHAVIANSSWTARQFCERYGEVACEVIYPGATTLLDPGQLPAFGTRSNGIVVLGRVVAGKRLETGVEIVRRLRNERGHDVHLHIVGNVARSYRRDLAALLAGNLWISWHPGLGRVDMERFISGKKWGIHCFPYEHYGIAPAELQRLGCIVFVPDEGGQREIVSQSELRYRDPADAVEKIHRVLCEPWRHDMLLANIAESNRVHDAKLFDDALKEYMQNFLARGG